MLIQFVAVPRNNNEGKNVLLICLHCTVKYNCTVQYSVIILKCMYSIVYTV